MIKKYISYMLAFMIIFSCCQVSNPARADENTFILTLSDASYVRGNSSNRDKPLGGKDLVIDIRPNEFGGTRMAFLKFDFKDYVDSIDEIDEVTLSLAPKSGGSSNVNYTVTILPDSCEDWTSDNLTFSLAEEKGMTGSDYGELIYTSPSLTDKVFAKSGNLYESVVKHLKENISNSVVVFKIFSTVEVAYTLYGKDTAYEPFITIHKSVNSEGFVDELYDYLTFDVIHGGDPTDVTGNFNLITFDGNGTNVIWKSSDEAVVNPATGVVTPPGYGEEDKNITLTATIENGGYSRVKTFEFTVVAGTVLPDEMVTEVLNYCTDGVYVRSGNNYEGNVYRGSNIVVDSRTTAGVYRMGFVRFDFDGMEEYLDTVNSISLRLSTVGVDETVDNNFTVTVIPEEFEPVEALNLSYTIAEEKGLVSYGTVPDYTANGIQSNTTYRTGNLLGAILKNLENSSNKTVWIKIASSKGTGYSLYGASGSLDLKPALSVKYTPHISELDLMLLDIPHTVSSDINLPLEGEFGSSLSWTSSDESIIDTNGKINVGVADEDYSKEDSFVTLGVTSIYEDEKFQKEYRVRVRRKGVIDAVADTYVTPAENLCNNENIVFGGTSGNVAIVSFDIEDMKGYISNSRKISLKLYASGDADGASVSVLPVTDEVMKELDIESVSYESALEIAGADDEYVTKAYFDNSSWIAIDVTDYVRSVKDGKAMFVLKSGGGRISVSALEGEINKEPKLIVSPIEYTDEYAAQMAADVLDESVLTNEIPDALRGNLFLPERGRYESSINWESDNENIINSQTGEVVRGEKNETVTLSAHIKVGKVTIRKDFVFTVVRIETDSEYAEFLLSGLKPAYDILTSSIELKGEEINAVWESSKPYEARVEGYKLKVNRPYGSDVSVTLTANIEINSKVYTKSFAIMVLRSADDNILWDREILSNDKASEKAIDEDISTVWNIQNKTMIIDMASDKLISGLTLVAAKANFGALNLSISDDGYRWEKVFSGGSFNAGAVKRIKLNTVAYGRFLKIEFPDEAKAVSYLAAYSYFDGDNADDVFESVEIPHEAEKDFELPDEIFGNKIKWTSSSKVIVADGNIAEVTPASSGKNVTLTAEVIINDKTYTKSYVIYVPGSDSSGGAGGGGKSPAGAGFIAAPTVGSSPAESPEERFTDLSSAIWAREYINYLADKGIVNGKSGREFAPNDNLKREEMAKIIALAFELDESQNTSGFTDVDENVWYAPYVATLKECGITKGMGDGTFGVGFDITRQDAFTMIASVLGCDSSSLDKTSFNDDEEIAAYARGGINALVSLGIVCGDEYGNVNPTKKITRAEIAKVICLSMRR